MLETILIQNNIENINTYLNDSEVSRAYLLNKIENDIIWQKNKDEYRTFLANKYGEAPMATKHGESSVFGLSRMI